MAEDTWNDTGRAEAPARRVADRYACLDLLGQGGFGRVWRAHDHLTGDTVALKLVPAFAPAHRERLRREWAALRHARFPGVVPLLDDGIDGDDGFLVMPWVRNARPFPGAPGAVRWERLIEPSLRLLGALARLHRAGFVHRDIKPGNVLVDDVGRVHLLDFGLARARQVAAGEAEGFEGTPAFAAPEHRRMGVVDGRADLWSVGALLYKALCGTGPLEGASPFQLFLAASDPPIVPLADQVGGVPPFLLSLVDQLLQPAPDARPPDAETVIEALGGEPPLAAPVFGDGLPERATQAELHGMFAGPDRFLHLAEDGARHLHARTGGWRPRVLAELDAWLRAGLADLQDGRVVLDREAIAALAGGVRLRLDVDAEPSERPAVDRKVLAAVELLAPDATEAEIATLAEVDGREVPAALARLEADGRVWGAGEAWSTDVRVRVLEGWPADEAEGWVARAHGLRPSAMVLLSDLAREAGGPPQVERLEAAALEAVADQRDDVGFALAEAGLGQARGAGRDALEARLSRLAVGIALTTGRPASFDRALRLVGTSRSPRAWRAQLELLARGWLAMSRGDAARVEHVLARLEPFEDELLETRRQGLRAWLAMGTDLADAEELLEGLRAWSGTEAEREAQRLAWLGNLRFLQGRYEEAAGCRMAAAERRATVLGVIHDRVSAASAWLEHGDPARSREVSEGARRLAARARVPLLEAYAAWLARSAAYRSDEALVPDQAAVRAAAQVSSEHGALHALVEGAIAYRAGHLAVARDLAEEAATFARSCGHRSALLLAEALAVACGADVAPDLVEEARGHGVDGVVVQVFGLLASRGAIDDDARGEGARRADRFDAATWSRRREILSVAEAVAHLSGKVPDA